MAIGLSPMRFLQRLKDRLLDIVYPPICQSCGMMGFWLCDACLNEVEEASLAPEVPAGIDGVLSCFAYADPKVRILTATYKYRSATAFELAQSTLLQHWVQQHSLPIWAYDASVVLVPILSPESRIATRGINHVLRLAQTFKRSFQLPSSISTVLGRLEHDKHNAELEHEERAANISGTFYLKIEPPKNIILIDDVLTTGSTLAEAARVLREGGAERVYAITFARG